VSVPEGGAFPAVIRRTFQMPAVARNDVDP
jgi:hypothetical protein